MTRVAMWSGPRNISTAMMRSWGARADTAVCDEPLYARYLLLTGADHPGRDEVIRSHPTDLEAVVGWVTGPIPEGRSIFYQKHMSHHVLAGDDTRWTHALVNAFLIRDPAEMITSYIKVVASPTPRDLGLPQQWDLFERERDRTGATPAVVDARDVLENPEGTLRGLCARVGVPFDRAMLAWPAGERPTDGVWARHWYDSVNRSTGFEPYRPKSEVVPGRLAAVERECRAVYERLFDLRIRAPGAT